MRFEELRLLAYGPFTDCTLRLRPGLNLLYGPNEAGKSSALRAVRGLLFGIGERTADSFRHNNTQLRVGAVLAGPDGQRIECVRRKGRKATLLDGDETPIDEDVLRGLLDGVNEEFFNSVFGIDHVDLRAGGDDVVRGKGRLGELLFAAGGVAHLREKQEALAAAAAELFKPGGSKPPLNRAIAQAKALKSEMVALQRSPDDWSRSHDELKRLETLEAKIKAEIEASESLRARLTRIDSALPILGAWRAKRAELESLSGVALLPADVAKRYSEAREQQTVAATQKRRALQRVEAIRLQLDQIATPTPLLDEARRIDDLYRRLGSHEKAVTDRPTLEGQQRVARNAAKRAIQKLGWSITLEEADHDRLPDDKKTRVRALASQYSGVKQAADQGTKALDRLDARVGELRERLAEPAPKEPPRALREAISAASSAMAAEPRVESLGEEIRRLKSDADRRLTRLTGWDGALEEIGGLRPPRIETVEEFDDRLKQLTASRERLATDERETREELRERQEKLAALAMSDSAPTEEELATRRRLRDRGVRLATESLRGATPNPDEVARFVRETNAEPDLATGLESSVREADLVVDRLRREADRVAEQAQLLSQQRSLEAKAERVLEMLAAVDRDQAGWRRDWVACWRESGVVPGTPREMRGWLRDYGELVEIADQHATIRLSQADQQQSVELAAKRLTGALVSAGCATPDGTSLETLHTRALRFVQETVEVIQLRERLEAELDRVEREVQEAKSESARAAAELDAWRTQWAAAIGPLRLPADALPEQAEAVLANLEELERSLDQAEGYRTRIWGIDKTAEEFAEEARRIASEVAPGLAEECVEKIATGLYQELSTAREAAKQQETLADQLQQEQQGLEVAEASLAEAAAVLDALVDQASCGSAEGLPAAIEASVNRQQLAARVEELAMQLAPFGAGAPLDAFAGEAEQEDADRLPGRVAELKSQIDDLRTQRDAAIEARQREASKLEQVSDAAAADKANEREFLLSRIESEAREYVVTTVASRLLQKAIERYQEKAQGPVLAGASRHFGRLTCGSFRGFKADFDSSGQEVLVGVRADGSLLHVEGMSEGTLDQVYLALRLGTIDHWFDRHTPIPLIVDDILLTFDDARATAALKTLLELSSRTQVLFFTHHEHLIALASQAASEDNTGPGLHVLRDWADDPEP